MATKTKSTTAIRRYNAAATLNNGKVGNIRYYTKGGRSYVRSAYNSTVTNPRTDKQMKIRLKWASMSIVWAVLKKYLNKGFEGSTPYVSTYNLFMRANYGNGIYLTKEDKYNDLLKLCPMVVSKGSLGKYTNTIETSGSNYYVTTNMYVGNASFVTLGDLSRVLINNNDIEEGDQITLLVIGEMPPMGGGSTLGLGRLKAIANYIIINTNSQSAISDLPVEMAKDQNGYLMFKIGSAGQKVGAAVIASRNPADGSLKTSSETLLCSSECNYADYQTEQALRIAIESYGKQDEIYLDPESHEEGATPTPPPVESYTVTLAVAQGQQAMGSVSGAGTYTAGSTAVIKAAANSGYHFVKWSDNDTNEQRNIVVNSNVNLVATFAADAPAGQVTITVNKKGSGAANGNVTGGGSYNVGDTVTLTASASGNASFNEWTRGGQTSSTNPLVFQATTNETIEAEFSAGF